MAGNKHSLGVDNKPHGGHQEDEVDVRAISRFGIGLLLLGIVIMGGLAYLFNQLKDREARRGVASMQAPDVLANRLPPEPRLQSTPVQDLKQMRAAEEQLLSSYAWIDPDHGVVRIPVDRAMELIVQRGLPVRSEAGTAPSGMAPAGQRLKK